jgi:uncharacterized membrane protein
MRKILKNNRGQALAIAIGVLFVGIVVLGIICLLYPPFYAWLKDLIETIGHAFRG